MAGKTRPMSQIKQILQLHKQGMTLNTIARTLGISRNTVKSYLHKLSLQKIDIDTLLKLDDPILELRFHAGNPAYLDGRFEYFKSRLAYYESELKRKHVTFVVTSIFSMITNFLGRSFFDKYPILLLLTGIGYSLFLFVLGYLGYMQNHTVAMLEEDTSISEENQTTEAPTNRKIKSQLQKLFEKEKIYTNKELKISDIATKLHSNRTFLSTFINAEYGCSFNTFVNQYRVEEAKKLLTSDENSSFSLDYITAQVGFGSLHSFIRVFKDITNSTPGRFREQTQTNQNDKME